MASPASLSGLEALLKQQASQGLPPVERWNPPYCGDIGMAIRRDGVWTYQGSPIGRMPMVRLFSRVLRKDDDGRTYLVTPVEKVDVAVEDAPFLAVEMEVAGAGAEQVLTFRSNVDDVVRCDREHPLRFEVEEEERRPQALSAGARAARSPGDACAVLRPGRAGGHRSRPIRRLERRRILCHGRSRQDQRLADQPVQNCSWLNHEQALMQVFQHAGGGAPDVAFGERHGVEMALTAAPGTGVLLMIGFVHQER